MKFLAVATLCLTSLPVVLSQEEEACAMSWKCHSTTTPPVLDADHSDWADVEAYTTKLINTVDEEYEVGMATYKCVYDTENIYFAMEIPGEYRFNKTDNHHCAAIGTMMKIGEKATFVDMGGCPDVTEDNGACDNGTIPETCDEYRVDVGAHWELKTTEMNTLYGLAASPAAAAAADGASTRQAGTGNDLIANNDDEYAVSSWCRFDDNDEKAENEWSGAWAHTNPVEGEPGTYHFEVSRLLKTPSMVSDKQMAPGETIQFGIAFWDPYEDAEIGWTKIGHYMTGCGNKWIDLELVAAGEEGDMSMSGDETTESGDEASSGVLVGVQSSVLALLAALVAGLR